jgi:hypothetical protein
MFINAACVFSKILKSVALKTRNLRLRYYVTYSLDLQTLSAKGLISQEAKIISWEELH